MFSSRWLHALCFFLIITWAGCSKERPVLQVNPTKGKAMFQGKPATGARLIFYTTLADGQVYQSSAKVGADGSYQLTSYQLNDGAPAGEYVVMAVWSDGSDDFPGPDKLKGKYSNRTTTPLKATIKPGENTLPTFELKE